METKSILFFYSGYWNGHGEGFFLPNSIHSCEITTSLLLWHQPQVLRWLKEIIIWLIMATGEFLLHKKLSWYQSDRSSMVPPMSIPFHLCCIQGTKQRRTRPAGFYRAHQKEEFSIFHLTASPNCKTFPWQTSLSLTKGHKTCNV